MATQIFPARRRPTPHGFRPTARSHLSHRYPIYPIYLIH